MVTNNKVRSPHISDARIAAARLLKDILVEGISLAQLPKYTGHLSTQDKAFTQALCYGCCRHFETLQGCVAQLMHKPLKEKDYDLYALIIVGCYQLAYMRTPAHAAINSTVEACRIIGKSWASKMLNAILRNFQRQHTQLLEKLTDWQQISHPQWLIDAIKTDWPQHFDAIITANNQQAPMCLRLHPQLDRVSYSTTLNSHNIANEACAFAPQGLRLKEAQVVSALPAFEKGLVSVQDEAAQLAALLLDPQQGEHILDACAAPGGKTCHILELAAAEVLALDIDAARCERIEENLERLGLRAAIQVADASAIDSWWDGQAFDKILLDAPCSATGVIRRHPDIKLLRRAEDIDALVTLQQILLEKLWRTLKPGGRLLYATCSILARENEQQIASFVANRQDVEILTIHQDWGVQLRHGRQLLPEQHSFDGFYYALLEKKYVDSNQT